MISRFLHMTKALLRGTPGRDQLEALPADNGERAPALIPARFAFVKLSVWDLDRVRAFYENVLGLHTAKRIESDLAVELVMRAVPDGFGLVLCQYRDERPTAESGRFGPLAFFVDDAAEGLRRALIAGGAIAREPSDYGSMRVRYFLDPEGNEVELLSKNSDLIQAE